MKNGKNCVWAHIHTECGILGEIDNVPEVKIRACGNDKYAIIAAAKADFAKTLADSGGNVEYAKYDSGDDNVWYIARDCSLVVIAVRAIEIPETEVA